MRLDQKKVTVQMRPPPLLFCSIPLTYTLLPFLSCLPPHPLLSLCKAKGPSLAHSLPYAPLLSLFPCLPLPKTNLRWKWGKMIIMGLLEKHKVKVTLSLQPQTPLSHLAWRQWDACATNHLYTLISASGPRCCLLLSEQMTLRKRSELGGKGGTR